MALNKDNWLIPSYRELGAYLVKGMSEEDILDRAIAIVVMTIFGDETTSATTSTQL